MKNYVQPGKSITLTADAAVTSGAITLIGAILGVATGAAAIGDPVTLVREGVFSGAPKTTGTAWTEGQKLYWNAGAGELTTVASGNRLAGVAVQAAASDDAVGTVFLDGVIR